VEYVWLALEGQEFLRFAACESSDAVADFARAFGTSGLAWMIPNLLPSSPGSSFEVPLVAAVAREHLSVLHTPKRGMFTGDTVDSVRDLYREAQLLRAVVDAYELATGTPARLGAAVRKWKACLTEDGGTSDPGRVGETMVLGPLVRAGLRLRREGNGCRFLPISGANFGTPPPVAQPQPRGLLFTRAGLWAFVAAVIDPVQALVRPTVRGTATGISQGSDLGDGGSTTLAVLYLEALDAFAARKPVRRCAWERCLGAPGRPHLFWFRSNLIGERKGDGWTWKPFKAPRQRRRGEDYCSPQCASAATTARSLSKEPRKRSIADADRRRARR